jgi:hypothetical protein
VALAEQLLPVLGCDPEGDLVRNVVAFVLVLVGRHAEQAGLGIHRLQLRRGVARDVRGDVGKGAERSVLGGAEPIVHEAQTNELLYLPVVVPEAWLHAVGVLLVFQLEEGV